MFSVTVRVPAQPAAAGDGGEPLLHVPGHQGPKVPAVGLGHLPGLREVHQTQGGLRLHRLGQAARGPGLQGQDGDVLSGRDSQVSVSTVQ